MKIRVNADDFGISPGVNSAILKMFLNKKLNSASLICGCKFFDEAIAIAKNNPELQIGLHFNLTTGNAVYSHGANSLLVDENGRFKNGFVKILLLSIFCKKKFLREVEAELHAQLECLKNSGIKINHIDGHRHIHFIPAIFKFVIKEARNRNISYVRIINESLINSWKINHPKSFLFDGGIIKWLILRILGIFNSGGEFSRVYFFSILYTCAISADLVNKIKVPQSFDELEIMIHPGDPNLDRELNLEEKNHLISSNRYLENW